MKQLINTTLINLSIIGLAYAGVNIDNRFLDLYQFLMWGLVLFATIALFIPSEELFKKAVNSQLQNFSNWFFTVAKVFISVWIGMSVLAAFYLAVSVFCYVKKKAYFDEVK